MSPGCLIQPCTHHSSVSYSSTYHQYMLKFINKTILQLASFVKRANLGLIVVYVTDSGLHIFPTSYSISSVVHILQAFLITALMTFVFLLLGWGVSSLLEGSIPAGGKMELHPQHAFIRASMVLLSHIGRYSCLFMFF